MLLSLLENSLARSVSTAAAMFVRRWWGPVVLVGAAIALLIWRIIVLGLYNWTHDEGSYIAAAWVVNDGHSLYHEVLTASPPLFIHSLALCMSMLGHSVAAARLAILAYCFIGFIAVGLVARELDGWLAALVAPLLLFVTPDVFGMSMRAFSTVPAMCFISLAVLGKAKYLQKGHTGWLVLAGVATAAGLLTKMVVLFAVPFPLIAILLRHTWRGRTLRELGYRSWLREILSDTLIAYVSMALPIAAYALLLGPQAVVDNTIRFQMEGRLYNPPEVLGNLQQIERVLLGQPALVLLAIYGAIKLYSLKPLRDVFLVGNAVALIIMLLIHSPLYDHHVIAVFFPLSALASVGISDIGRQLWALRKPKVPRRILFTAIGAGLLAVYLLLLPGYVRVDARGLEMTHTPDESETVAIHFLQQTTTPNDLIFSDEPMLPLLADRQILPSLTEMAWKRFRVGDLTSGDLIELTQHNQPAAVVVWKERFENSPYDFWLRQNYHLGHLDSTSHRIYLRSASAIPEDRWLTKSLILLGYNYDVEEVPAEGLQVKITLFWRPLVSAAAPKLHLKIMDSAYHVWGQTAGIFQWAADEKHSEFDFLPDQRLISVWPGTPPGQYQISVAYFGTSDEPDDEVFIGPIMIPRHFNPRNTLDMPHPVDARLADQVALLGYKATDTDVRPGDSVHLTLFWQALTEMKQNYTVFVHLLSADGRLVDQKDNEPIGGFYPTSRWEKGETVRDPYDLTVPPNAPPGPYRLLVGMYDARTGERLPTTPPAQAGHPDGIVLDAINDRRETK